MNANLTKYQFICHITLKFVIKYYWFLFFIFISLKKLKGVKYFVKWHGIRDNIINLKARSLGLLLPAISVGGSRIFPYNCFIKLNFHVTLFPYIYFHLKLKFPNYYKILKHKCYNSAAKHQFVNTTTKYCKIRVK